MVSFSECPTVAANCNTETQIEMGGGTVEYFDPWQLSLPASPAQNWMRLSMSRFLKVRRQTVDGVMGTEVSRRTELLAPTS